MSKFDDIKIPENIDEVTKIAINRGKKYNKSKRYKKVMIASAASIAVGTSIIGIGIMNPSIADSIPILKNIVEYFNTNNESLYKSDKDEFEKLGTEINLTTKDKGIELTLDSASVDENYLTIFYTIKTEKNIKETYEVHHDASFANPYIGVYIDGEDIVPMGSSESEATFSSENELKGMCKVDISYIKLNDNIEFIFETDSIFRVEGNWSITTRVDKSKSDNDTYRYELDKDFVLNKTDKNMNGENYNVINNVNIERVIISPLANKIVINEKIENPRVDCDPIMLSAFALFDQNGKSLDVIDKGGRGSNTKTGIATNSIEFLKADKNTTSLTLVPFEFDESLQNNQLEPQSIDKLPVEFEGSNYGKVILEDVQIKEKEIRYTYYKDGVVPGNIHFSFFDKDKNEIIINGGVTRTAIDRNTGRYTAIWKFEGYEDETNISKFKEIKYASIYKDNSFKLLYNQEMKIDLVK